MTRAVSGVKLIKLDEGDKLVAMAKVDAEETPKGDGEPEVPESNTSEPQTPPADSEQDPPDDGETAKE